MTIARLSSLDSRCSLRYNEVTFDQQTCKNKIAKHKLKLQPPVIAHVFGLNRGRSKITTRYLRENKSSASLQCSIPSPAFAEVPPGFPDGVPDFPASSARGSRGSPCELYYYSVGPIHFKSQPGQMPAGVTNPLGSISAACRRRPRELWPTTIPQT